MKIIIPTWLTTKTHLWLSHHDIPSIETYLFFIWYSFLFCHCFFYLFIHTLSLFVLTTFSGIKATCNLTHLILFKSALAFLECAHYSHKPLWAGLSIFLATLLFFY